MRRLSIIPAMRVAAIYFVFSALWIFFSDQIMFWFVEDIDAYMSFSTIKGMAFILLSSIVIYALVRREVRIAQIAQENIRHVSHHDSLTGLNNRNEFNEYLAKMNEDNRVASLVVTDINGLRMINELYGSATGDKVLVYVASLLEDMCCKDHNYRIGGDEFCTIYEGQDIPHIQEALITLTDKLSHQTVFDFPVSISTGLAIKKEFESIYETLSKAEGMVIKGKLLQEQSASNSLIQSLKTTLFEHSDETEQHAQRIVEICEAMGNHLHMNSGEISELKLFALLHDIGKVGIEDRILKKPGKLTKEEYLIIQRHSAIGYRISKSVTLLESIADFILAHHERWDGLGYPQGLKEETIPLPSRILAIADTYDAITNDRIYRKARSKEEAFEEIAAQRGKQFDPNLVDIFFEVMEKNQ